ncbi:MAG: hypothetical protein AAB289_01305, partial [Chloroflexota bacterium]
AVPPRRPVGPRERQGAQDMLDVRSVHVDGAWDGYQTYRIERETRDLYPHRRLVEGTQYAMAS